MSAADTATPAPPAALPDAQRADLRAKAEAAPKGPWRANPHGVAWPHLADQPGSAAVEVPDWPHQFPFIPRGTLFVAHAEYVAAAHPQAVLALLAERDRLAGRLAEVARERDEAQRWRNEDTMRSTEALSALTKRAEALAGALGEAGRLLVDHNGVCRVCFSFSADEPHASDCPGRALLAPPAADPGR